jgi:hypothetical protein
MSSSFLAKPFYIIAEKDITVLKAGTNKNLPQRAIAGGAAG